MSVPMIPGLARQMESGFKQRSQIQSNTSRQRMAANANKRVEPGAAHQAALDETRMRATLMTMIREIRTKENRGGHKYRIS